MSLLVIFNSRRIQVKYTGSTALSIVRDKACQFLAIKDPQNYQLRHGKQTLDLSLPVRLSGLVANAKLDLVYGTNPAAVIEAAVKVKLQIVGEEPLVNPIATCSNNWSVWQVLSGFESRAQIILTNRIVNGIYMLPNVQILDTLLESVEDLKKSLKTLGCQGSVVFRVKFVSTGKSWQEFAEINELKAGIDDHGSENTTHKEPVVLETPCSGGESKREGPSNLAPTKRNNILEDKNLDVELETENLSSKHSKTCRQAQIYLTPDSNVTIPTSEEQEMNMNQFAKYQSHLKSAYDKNDFLMTKSLKEQQAIARLSKIKTCIVRVRLPDQSYIEGTFSHNEKVCDIYNFIQENLKQELAKKTSFTLFLTPPKQYLIQPNQRLIPDLKFGPRNVLHLEWKGDSAGSASEIFKDDLYATAKSITEAEDVRRYREAGADLNRESGIHDVKNSSHSDNSKRALSKPKWMKLSK